MPVPIGTVELSSNFQSSKNQQSQIRSADILYFSTLHFHTDSKKAQSCLQCVSRCWWSMWLCASLTSPTQRQWCNYNHLKERHLLVDQWYLCQQPTNLWTRELTDNCPFRRNLWQLQRYEPKFTVHVCLRRAHKHWLQTYRALHGDAPQYLRQFTPVADIPSRQRLRSSTSDDLCVPAVRLPTVGRRAFSVAGARVWNALPADVTSAPSLFTSENV